MAPALVLLATLGLGSLPLPGLFQMPRLGEVRSGLCLGHGNVFYAPQFVFVALPWAGERRWVWIFFSELYLMSVSMLWLHFCFL